MFEANLVRRLATQHLATLQNLNRLRLDLEGDFQGLEDAILGLILSVASGEPLLLIGPPGTAKSMLIRTFCSLVGIEREKTGGYFEYLLTPFTEPGELFGFYDPKSLVDPNSDLKRINENRMMQNAAVVFLDEIFKGSSAILNALLSFMNERVFYDRGLPVPVKLRCLLAASNELPESTELQAVSDRFALRCRVDNVAEDGASLEALMKKAWPLTYGRSNRRVAYPGLLDGLKALQTEIRGLDSLFQPHADVFPILAQLVQLARTNGVSALSNRRLVKFTYVMLIHRLFDLARGDPKTVAGKGCVRAEELRLLPKYFLDDDTKEEPIAQMDAAIKEWARR